MKRDAVNTVSRSWTNGKVTATFIALFVVCTFLNLSASNTMGQLLPPAAVNLQSSSPKTAKEIEYEVKAAFIYNFMKFVEWPKEKKESRGENQNTDNPMIIGVLGGNPFDSAFLPILNKEVHGRKIQLVEIQSYQEFYDASGNKSNALAAYQAEYQAIIASCDVLFICESEHRYVEELLGLASGHSILIISDLPEFVENGGMIGFVKDKNKIRFEINLDAVQKENIKIRSQLLTLAKKVHETKK